MRNKINSITVLLFLLSYTFSSFSQNLQNDSVIVNNPITDSVIRDSSLTKGLQSPEVISELNDSQNENYILEISICVLLFICGIIIGALLVYFYTRKHIYSILSDEKSTYIKELNQEDYSFVFKYIGLVYILYSSKNDYKSKFVNLQQKFKVVQGKTNGEQIKSQNSNRKSDLDIGLKESKLANDDIVVEQEYVPNNVIEWKVDQEMIQTNILYFSIPEADGSFKIVNGKTVKELDCFYKIEIDKNNQKGKLFFISSEFDSRALDNIDYYLNPVCEIENISDRTHAKKINVVDFGTVVLNGDTWKIESNKKLKIRLI
jgi:hypothetical protein